MRRAIIVLGAVLGACGSRSDAPASQGPAVAAPAAAAPAAVAPAAVAPAADAGSALAPAIGIVWAISVSPATVTMARRSSVVVTIRAANVTGAVRDPHRDPLDVLVDGTSSMELSMAFGNGVRVKEWSAIPPGQYVTDSREGMELVTAPGDHVITIAHDGHELARTVLHVAP